MNNIEVKTSRSANLLINWMNALHDHIMLDDSQLTELDDRLLSSTIAETLITVSCFPNIEPSYVFAWVRGHHTIDVWERLNHVWSNTHWHPDNRRISLACRMLSRMKSTRSQSILAFLHYIAGDLNQSIALARSITVDGQGDVYAHLVMDAYKLHRQPAWRNA